MILTSKIIIFVVEHAAAGTYIVYIRLKISGICFPQLKMGKMQSSNQANAAN